MYQLPSKHPLLDSRWEATVNELQNELKDLSEPALKWIREVWEQSWAQDGEFVKWMRRESAPMLLERWFNDEMPTEFAASVMDEIMRTDTPSYHHRKNLMLRATVYKHDSPFLNWVDELVEFLSTEVVVSWIAGDYAPRDRFLMSAFRAGINTADIGLVINRFHDEKVRKIEESEPEVDAEQFLEETAMVEFDFTEYENDMGDTDDIPF